MTEEHILSIDCLLLSGVWNRGMYIMYSFGTVTDTLPFKYFEQ